MKKSINTSEITIGVVGLGLMGNSIVTCLLIAGHPVVGVAPMPDDLKFAENRIKAHLKKSKEQGLVNNSPKHYLKQLTITEDYNLLNDCSLVIECTIEDMDIKKSVHEKIERVIKSDCLLTSNTSAIPISMLQKLTLHPGRFFGLHWTVPAQTTRFLEVICGDLSDQSKAEYLYELSYQWGKEPILVRKDIRGFIANRLMYAMYREAFHLVENGYASIEDVDRACRNNTGYFMTLVGVFRWMDLTGVPAYHTVMKELFPTLNNDTKPAKLIEDIVSKGGKGVANAQGFYNYTEEEARLWEETYKEFSYEIRKLALKYPADVVTKKLGGKKKKKHKRKS
ncbi:MAG TPA: 3-hydroxyacyl-CoA dehydrogenase family protein [Chitinophagaceae bacterium]|nr:3-hydroxyacyl-CoA dehydrogenase family protein [Chitinophagaceae bacterium]